MSTMTGTGKLLRAAALCLSGFGLWGALRSAAEPAPVRPTPPPAESLDQRFTTQVRPFLQRYCFACHGPRKQEAKLDLSRDTTAAAAAKNVRHWMVALDRLQA